MKKILACLALAALFLLPASVQATPGSGYWWNPAEGGRGFVIEVQGNQMFMAGFLYDVSGRATWVAASGAMNSSTQYSGPLITYTGGQTLTGLYTPGAHPSAPFGNITITFTSDTQGSITWPGGTIPIQRLDIVPGGSSAAQSAANPETGWWWNPAEGGRGFAIEVQNGTMYFAGYMYDQSGNPIWYLANGAMGSSVTFQGEWTQYANGQTLTGKYKPPTLVNSTVGSVLLQFTNAYTATLTLPGGRQIPFVRFGFGVTAPVMSAFSPNAAEPEALLTLTGTGFDPNGTVTLTLSDNAGYSVNVPAASVTSTAVKVSVPPYIVASSGAFGSSAVSLQATQKSAGVSLTSNTLSGFTIQALPTAKGTAGASTLALINANLAEAQKLQTSINGTPQATPAVAAALAQQVSNLQSLVTNIQNVVQGGQSFALGVIGGVNITVTPSNIADVDSLILAALQSLANPPTGSALKSAQAASPACLATEASAFATAMTSGSGNLQQLAQSLLEASQTSTACGTVAAFSSAYQIFGGAAGVGLGISNGNGVVSSRLPGAALFAATATNASTAVGLNALISPALASQVASVKTAIANVTTQSNPTTNQLLAKTTGALATNISGAQTVSTSSTTSTGIQKAKDVVNALNSDAALITGANSPPAVLKSFKDQFTPIGGSIQSIANGGANPAIATFAEGSVRVSGAKNGSTTTYSVLVTPTAGGSYASTWVVTETITGTLTTASGQVSGQLMPVSTGAAPTQVSGNVSMSLDTAPGATSTVTLTSLSVSDTNNGAGKPEAISFTNFAITEVNDSTGNPTVTNASGTLTVSIGASNYSIVISLKDSGPPITSATINMSYTGPNGAFAFTLQETDSGTNGLHNITTQVFSFSQGTIAVSGTIGPYDNRLPAPPFPTTLNVYDGTTLIGTFSGKTISFVDGSFITFSF